MDWDAYRRKYGNIQRLDRILRAMDHLRGLILPMRFRGLLIEVTLEGSRLRVGAEIDSLNRSVKLGVGDQIWRELYF